MQSHSQPRWLDEHGRCFNPTPRLSLQPTGLGGVCVVVDDALANPHGLRAWAAAQHYQPPDGYPYPGVVCAVPVELQRRLADFYMQHGRKHLRARRMVELTARLSVVNTPPDKLAPVQWLCHRDRLPDPGSPLLFAASVLYLFDDPALGGTSFYASRQSATQTERIVADSQCLPAEDFAGRYGLKAGYMTESNLYFERTAQVAAAWNRMIFYDGSQFHSADVDPVQLRGQPQQARLTLNGFVTCRRATG